MQKRAKHIKGLKRIVVKIGSSSLTAHEGFLDIGNMKKFCREIKEAVGRKLQVIVVSSGAIAAGLQKLGIGGRPEDISMLQAAASVGQVELMRIYSNIFADEGIKVGQILLTQEDTTSREQYLNIRSTIETLLGMGIVPVINENDSVAVDEIKFGDNDILAALVASLTDSDLLVILTDIEGLYEKDPKIDPQAKVIKIVDEITEGIEEISGGAGSLYGLGGMASKVRAAKVCHFSGIGLAVANSREERVLARIIDGEDIGTFFVPQKGKKVKSLKRWIAFGMRAKGSIVIDEGAKKAIIEKGKSILPVGVVDVEGSFNPGDTLKVYSLDGELIAKGISNFSDKEVRSIKGKNEKQLSEEIGGGLCKEIIHRDCLVVFKS